MTITSQGRVLCPPGEGAEKTDLLSPEKTHKWFASLSKPSNKNQVPFTPTCGVSVFTCLALFYHRRGKSCAHRGRGRNVGAAYALKDALCFLRGIHCGLWVFEREFLLCCHARPSAVWDVPFHAPGRARDPPLRGAYPFIYDEKIRYSCLIYNPRPKGVRIFTLQMKKPPGNPEGFFILRLRKFL